MEILIKASQLLLSLSILIILHELGHFIPAKLFKTRVEKFYLFFDPWFSLFKKKKGDTEYGIGWIPLGGYVKISGMIDESMDKEQMKQAPQPWEFRSKPAWQRLIIMIGGVAVNVLVAVFIYIGILFINGEEYLPNEQVKFGIACDSLALQIGLRDGDRIMSVDGERIENFAKIPLAILLSEKGEVVVERNGKLQTLYVTQKDLGRIVKKSSGLIGPRFPFIVDEFLEGSAGKAAGIQKNDVIVAVNGIENRFFDAIKREIVRQKNKNVNLTVFRNGQYKIVSVKVSEKGTIGVIPYPAGHYFSFAKKEYSFFEAIPAGIKKTGTSLGDYLNQFKLIFNKEVKGYESIGGFISFGKVFSPEWDWLKFWNLTAFFSVALAIMNILPIPALDGGHVLFLLYEVVTGRKPGDKFLEYAQTVGMFLLLGLLIYANVNDIVRLFTGH